ncbi:MAG TPA: cupin domain-containing protein [Humisphaera sp.]|jgi:quercetin dioxygenase-like cupin family protein|nr:cupin domain-containing protein [Humisphaera sp.]
MRRTFIQKLLQEIPIEGAHGGTGRRQMLLSKEDDVCTSLQAVTKGYLDPGGVFDWHHHDGVDEFFIVLTGSGTITYDLGQEHVKRTYEAGSIFNSPAGMPHRIEADGPTASEFIFVRLAAT